MPVNIFGNYTSNQTSSLSSDTNLENSILTEIGNVTVQNPTDGQVLTWETASNKWKNKNSTSGSLIGLSDTAVSAPIVGQQLRYNALNKWENFNPPVTGANSLPGGLADVYKQNNAGTLEFKSLRSNNNSISIIPEANNVDITLGDFNLNVALDVDNTPPIEGQGLIWRTNKYVPELISSGGEVNTGFNEGTGSSVFKNKIGTTLNFRTLIGGNLLNNVQNTDDVTLDFTPSTLDVVSNQVSYVNKPLRDDDEFLYSGGKWSNFSNKEAHQNLQNYLLNIHTASSDVIIPSGSTWFYSSNGTDQYTSGGFKNIGYSPGLDWSLASAPFGHNIGATTTLSQQNAYYFYIEFNLDTTLYDYYTFEISALQGYEIWINGNIWGQYNVPGVVTHSVSAVTKILFQDSAIVPVRYLYESLTSSFLAGSNSVGVVLFKNQLTDISYFDLEIKGHHKKTTYSDVGSGVSLVKQQLGNNIEMKTLIGSAPINIASGANSNTISYNSQNLDVTALDVNYTNAPVEGNLLKYTSGVWIPKSSALEIQGLNKFIAESLESNYENVFPFGSSWQYSHNATNQHVSGFDVNGFVGTGDWLALAPSPFGHGTIEGVTFATTLNNNNGNEVYYFRKEININDIASINSLAFSIGIDDGYEVRINGTEIDRYNVTGVTTINSAADTSIGADAEGKYRFKIVKKVDANLLEGLNTISVIIFKFPTNGGQDDAWFDFSLNLFRQKNLENLSNVVITAPVNNQVLTYSGGNWINQAGGGGPNAISDLSDVDTVGVSLGNLLSYQTGNVWKPIVFDFQHLDSCSLGELTQYETLIYDVGGSGEFTNNKMRLQWLGDVDVSGTRYYGDTLEWSDQINAYISATKNLSTLLDANTSGNFDITDFFINALVREELIGNMILTLRPNAHTSWNAKPPRFDDRIEILNDSNVYLLEIVFDVGVTANQYSNYTINLYPHERIELIYEGINQWSFTIYKPKSGRYREIIAHNTNISLSISDLNHFLEFSGAGTQIITVNQNLVKSYDHAEVEIFMGGAGEVHIAPQNASVLIFCKNCDGTGQQTIKLANQWTACVLKRLELADNWVVIGDVSAIPVP